MSTSLEEVRLRRVLSQEIHHLATSHPLFHSRKPIYRETHCRWDKQILNEGPKGRGRAGRQAGRQEKKMAGRQAGPGEMCVTVHSELCCVCDGGRSVAHPASVIATVCPRDAPYAQRTGEVIILSGGNVRTGSGACATCGNTCC